MSQLKHPVTDRDHRLGPDGAPASLVEYGDYQCPYCAAADPMAKVLIARLGSQLQYVFRHFPLSTIHPMAELAAEAAEAAAAQGRFWEMHEALFANQEQLGPELFAAAAQTLGLDVQRFGRELGERVYRDRVQQDFMSGVRSGVNGTPTFFINGVRYDEPVEVDSLAAALELAARRSGQSSHAAHAAGH